jgi:hypothetical protein
MTSQIHMMKRKNQNIANNRSNNGTCVPSFRLKPYAQRILSMPQPRWAGEPIGGFHTGLG